MGDARRYDKWSTFIGRITYEGATATQAEKTKGRRKRKRGRRRRTIFDGGIPIVSELVGTPIFLFLATGSLERRRDAEVEME